MSRLHHWPSRLGVYVCNFWETAKAQYLWREDFPSGLPGEETGKPHSPGTAPAETLMFSQQIRMLYQSSAIMLFNVPNSAITAYLLREAYPKWLLVDWVGALALITIARLWNSWLYWRQPQPAEAAAKWARRFVAGAILTGCLWGLAASVIFVTPDSKSLALVALVLSGMALGAVVGHSAYLPAMAGFAAPVILPIMFAFFAQATATSVALGLLTAAFAIFVGMLTHRANYWIMSLIRQGIALRALVADRDRKAAEIEYRNKLRHAISSVASDLLTDVSLDEALPKVLETIGQAVRVDHILLLELPRSAGAEAFHFLRCGWHAPSAPAKPDADFFLKARQCGIEADPWFAPLRDLKSVSGFPRTMNAGPAKTLFEKLGISSILVEPLAVGGKYWGRICFDDCKTEREWTPDEIETLQIVANMIASSLIREQYVEELRDAKTIVERSPTILYRLQGEPSLPLIYVSENVTSLGYSPDELLNFPELYKSLIHPDDAAKLYESMTHASSAGSGPAHVELRWRMANGSYRWFDVHYSPIRDTAGRLIHIEGILTDITERKETEERIAVLARTDSLTGLANRGTFINFLRQAFAAARRGANPFAILYVDLDHFKDINDTLGHSAGDLLLKSVARRLKAKCRESDLVARLGGDEFAILQTEAFELSDAAALASKIHNILSAPYRIGDNELHLSGSIGVSIYTKETAGPDELLIQADLALYRAKEEGRDQYCFHSEELDREIRERVTITEDLKKAIANNELELYYQPQVELSTGQIAGMEALIRWNHPKRGQLKPHDFIPIVEKSSVIVTLGQWVLDHACQQMSLWRSAGIDPQTLAVNLSLAQLRTGDEFVQSVTATLVKWGLSPSDLELDVTESMLAHVTLARNDVLDRLQQLGVKIAIDDFGTQYSSLDYLKTYRVSCVKIPRAMINATMNRDQNDSSMVRAIIGLARELNIEVVAQGVENEAQREFLTAAPSTTKVQGYYYSAPVPASDATELLRQRRIQPRLSQVTESNAAQ